MTRDYVQRSSVANDSSIKSHNSASYFSLKLSPLYSSLSIYPDVYPTAMRFAGFDQQWRTKLNSRTPGGTNSVVQIKITSSLAAHPSQQTQ